MGADTGLRRLLCIILMSGGFAWPGRGARRVDDRAGKLAFPRPRDLSSYLEYFEFLELGPQPY